MFGSSAASRRFLRVRKLLIGLQVILLLFTMIAPVGTIAADPTPAPSESPTPSEPTPSVDPSPSVDPAPSADPTAPPPDPTATPDPTTAPDPSVVPDPTPEPTPDPTPAPVTVAPYIVTFVGGTSTANQAAAIAAAGAVDLDSIPVLRMHAIQASDAAASALRADDSVATVELDRSRAAEAAPDDTAYADQWSLPKIGWDLAYDSISPSGTAIVAILDTGVDGSHSDLVGKLVGGISLLGTDPATDSNGHGTAMAGIVAASTNNGSGIAGVGYAGVKVMPVTVLNSAGLGRDSDIIEGLVWAADHGADVALMAFSASGYSSSLQAAVDYAWSQGVVLVAATGNDGSSLGSFPAGDAGVIGVSSTDQSDALAANSNYGTSTFLAAPGVGIPTLSLGGGVTSVSGTSAAAAHVAAAAALLRAHDAALSNGVVVGRLARTADAAGTAEQTGNGRLNLARALNDVSTEAVKPAGAAPVGDGGPFVGPYVAAAASEVSGIVKNDLNGNGVDNSDPVLGGVPVLLWEDRDDDGVFEPIGDDAPSIRTSTSNASGVWSFTTASDFNNSTRYFVSIGSGFNTTAAFACIIGGNGSGHTSTVTGGTVLNIFFNNANPKCTGGKFLVQAAAVSDLAVTKTDGVTSVNAGGSTTYTVRVTNLGPSSVTGAILKDPATAGLTKGTVACSATPGQCTVGTTPTAAQLESAGGFALPTLSLNQFYEITIVTSVTATSGSVSNTATIAAPAGTTDNVVGNNSATDTDTVTPVADLAITKTDGVTSVNAGGSTTYTVRVTNNGPSSVTGAVLTDAAAAGLSKTTITCSATPGQCTVGTTPTVAQLQAGVRPAGPRLGSVLRDHHRHKRDCDQRQRLQHGHDRGARRDDRQPRRQQQRDRHRHAHAERRSRDHQDRRRDQRHRRRRR